MVAAEPAGHDQSAAPARRLPPVIELAVGTMALVIVGGIYLAAYLPRQTPLALPIAVLVVAVALLAANVVALSRVRPFAWRTFFVVWRWAMLAYLVIAGMLVFVFVRDGTPRTLLVMLTLMLAVFAADIPLLFAFSVARYQPVDRSAP